jgi:hypothetical protein
MPASLLLCFLIGPLLLEALEDGSFVVVQNQFEDVATINNAASCSLNLAKSKK